ncbi:MAG: FAD assembly factor SdhE [Halothiobacillus sp.]
MTLTDKQDKATALDAQLLSINPELNRLRWRCRRGMWELDITLNRFLDERFAQLTPAQRHEFEQLITLEDRKRSADPPVKPR